MGLAWATGGLDVAGELLGFPVVNPTWAVGDRTEMGATKHDLDMTIGIHSSSVGESFSLSLSRLLIDYRQTTNFSLILML
jgi:hypothetical protein